MVFLCYLWGKMEFGVILLDRKYWRKCFSNDLAESKYHSQIWKVLGRDPIRWELLSAEYACSYLLDLIKKCQDLWKEKYRVDIIRVYKSLAYFRNIILEEIWFSVVKLENIIFLEISTNIWSIILMFPTKVSQVWYLSLTLNSI